MKRKQRKKWQTRILYKMSKGVFAYLYLCVYSYTMYALYKQYGSWRTVLSTMVTFSNQVATLMACVSAINLSTTNDRLKRYIDPLMDLLELYGTISMVVFTTAILPMYGWALTFPDLLIHGVLVVLFIGQVGRRTDRNVFIPFSVYMVYPALYTLFAFYISHRRGYMLYPFMQHPAAMTYVLCIVLGAWKMYHAP